MNKDLPEYKPFWPETAVIWGAGATADLGIPATYECGQIISSLAGVDDEGKFTPGVSLAERFKRAFGEKDIHEGLAERFKELLILLFDGDDAVSEEQSEIIYNDAIDESVKRLSNKYNLSDNQKHWLEFNLKELEKKYDWVGVRSLAPYIARDWNRRTQNQGAMNLRDLLTVVDLLIDQGMALPSEELFRRPTEKSSAVYYIDRSRLPAVKRCLGYLIALITRITIQKRPGFVDEKRIKPYVDIFELLADLMVDEGKEYIKFFNPQSRKFYLYSYSLVSFNWEPLTLWLNWNAHDKINNTNRKVAWNKSIRLYNDNGDGIGIRQLLESKNESSDDILAFLMNESICRRVNGDRFQKKVPTDVFRIGKTMVPHAGLGWRICQRCGKLFTDFGKNLGDINSTVCFGPDLLPELNQAWKPRTAEEETKQKLGEFGAMQCVFCGSVTYPYDSPLMLQSAIKSERHYVLEGIFREMGLLIGNARHIVLAGYSLPPDDYLYKVFFQSAMAGKETQRERIFCTLINYDPEFAKNPQKPVWLEGESIKKYLKRAPKEDSTWETIERVLELFPIDQIRVSLKGIPGVVTKRRDVGPKRALIDLLYPKKCFPEGFPPNRR